MRRGAVAVLATAAAAACSSGDRTAAPATTPEIVVVPGRAATAGEPLLARLPAGAQLLVEVDLARLRGNPAVGDVATAVIGGPGVAALGDVDVPGAAVSIQGAAGAPLAQVDTLVLASYQVGTDAAYTVTLLTGAALTAEAVPGGVALDGGVVALGPPEAVRGLGDGPRASDDLPLRALRARAMPAGAEGATLRITAALDRDARLAMAGQLGVDVVPAALSLWADVADDVAVVASLEAPETGAEMGAAVRALAERLAGLREVAALGLAPALRATRVDVEGDTVKAVALIGPRRLDRAMRRARTFLQLATEAPDSKDSPEDTP